MKILKKTILWLSLIVLTLTVLTAGLVTWVIKNPQSAWKFAEEHFLPDDLNVTWDSMEFHARHFSGLNFYFDWKIHDLHIKKEKHFINFPIDFVRLETSIFLRSPTQKIIAHDWQLKTTETMRLNLSPKEGEVGQSPFQTFKNFASQIKSFRRLVEIENLDVKIKEFRYQKIDFESFVLSLDAVHDRHLDPDTLNYKTSVTLPNELSVSSKGRIFLNKDPNRPFLGGNIKVVGLGIHANQNFKVKLNDLGTRIQLSGKVYYNKKNTRIAAHPSTHLEMSSEGAKIDLQTDLTGAPGHLIKVDSIKAHLYSPFDDGVLWSGRPTQLSFSVLSKLLPLSEPMKSSLRTACECEIPETLLVNSKGEIWLSNLMSKKTASLPILDLSFRIDDIENKFLSLHATAHLKVTKKADDYAFRPSLDVTGEIFSYKNLANILSEQSVVIPTPFNALDGSIHFQVNGPVSSTLTGYTFPAATTTQLVSQGQIVDLKAKANVHLNANFKAARIDVQGVINQVQLVLPPLKLTEGKPRIIPDKRILTKPRVPKKRDGFRLAFTFEVETAQPGAIRLFHQYFKPSLPLTMDIRRSAEKENSGFIRIEPFDIVYLKRTVNVEKMVLDLSRPDEKALLVDGRLMVKKSFYTVFIDIHGPANKPNIILRSSPYLPRAEIISVLLYDRTSDQLISADAETAGQVEAAVAERAIGLFGIWAFAATPIRSFSYNPVSKVYSATIAVADSVTASVGTNWEETTQVELRKRVSRRWVLTAAWTYANEDEVENSKVVLQWERRF